MSKNTLQLFVVIAALGIMIFSLPAHSLAAAASYQAEIVEQSNYIINLLPDKGFTFSVKYRNIGSEAWSVNDQDFLSIKSSKNPSVLAHKFWPDKHTPVTTKKSVYPGETIILTFAIQAPDQNGLYIEYFGLTYGGYNMIPGSLFELPINITNHPHGKAPRPVRAAVVQEDYNNDATVENKQESEQNSEIVTEPPKPVPIVNDEPNQTVPDAKPIVAGATTVQDLPLLENEPIINVGLYFAENKIITITADGEFGVYENGVKQASFGAGTMAKVHHVGGVYNLILPSGTASFSSSLTFRAHSANTILELPDYERRVGWNNTINDNRYRGEIQIKHNSRTDRLWAINTLMLEDYVAGIDEASNIEVPEFHKSLAVAARTYALFHLMSNQRYSGFFHVDDNNDQIYRGYNASRRLNHFVAAAEATRGQVVTLNNEIVVTPYFTQSAGQTKDYKSVWGTASGLETSHLVSVPVPQDTGRQLLGHGVGMSAQGAQRMAYLDNLDYLSILQHFYTNTKVSKIYQ